MVSTARKWTYPLITGLALALAAGCSSDSNPAGTGTWTTYDETGTQIDTGT